MTWNPAEHTDDENRKWCWLRSIEWGRWPLFLARPLVPVFLLWYGWASVILAVVGANLVWAGLVRYRYVNVRAAFLGVLFVMTWWVSWPVATFLLFRAARSPEAWISLSWPALQFVVGAIPTTAIGRIQVQFMRALGYEPTPENPLSGHA